MSKPLSVKVYQFMLISLFSAFAICLSANESKEEHDSLQYYFKRPSHEIFYAAEDAELKEQYTLAINLYKVCDNVSKFDSNEYLGRSLIKLSNLYWYIGNTESALFYGIQAKTVYDNSDDTLNYILANNSLSQCYISEGDFIQAQKLLNETFQLIKLTSDSTLLADYYLLRGVVDFFEDNYSASQSNYFKALGISNSLSPPYKTAILLGNIGEVHHQTNNPDSALWYFQKAMKLDSNLRNKSITNFLSYSIGNVYAEQLNYDKALLYYERSIAIMHEIGEYKDLPMVLDFMSDIYIQQNKYKEAYNTHLTSIAIRDSLRDKRTNYYIEELKSEHRFTEMQQLNAALNQEKLFNDQQLMISKKLIRNQKLVMLLLFAGLISSFLFLTYIIKSKKNLRLANNTKDKLFSIIGHDLRGPVGTAKNLCDLYVTNSDHSKEDLEYAISTLSHSLNSTYNLLDGLLDWANQQQNAISFHPKSINIETLLRSIMQGMEPFCKQKNISLNSVLDKNIYVFADENMLQIIFTNLISNALKFTPSKGSVVLKTYQNKEQIEIHIIDSGIGMREETLKKILDPNVYYTTMGTNKEKGTGLGLALCIDLIKTNKGKLLVSSTPEKGTTFTVSLPIPIDTSQ